MKLSRKVIIWSVILYFALSIPLSLFHELGHVLVCAAHGFDYAVSVDARGGHSICYGGPRNDFAYNAMGGVFGMIASTAIIAVWAFCKGHYAILVVGLAYMVDQFAKSVLEGFFIRMYVSGALDGYITALQIISWLGFMLYFARIREPATVVRA